MKVFLTGGTGFIGSYVAMELVRHHHQVTILARNKNKVPALGKIGGIEIVEGDLGEKALLEKLVSGKDACIHVALKYTRQTGWEVLEDDTLPTVFLSDVAVKAKVRSFIYTSSTAANDSLYAVAEEFRDKTITSVTALTKHHPATFYGATKAASEDFLMAQSYQSAMRINIIRPGYTFGNPVVEGGSTQGDQRFFDIVRDALRGDPISVVKNDGTQFIWGGDLAQLYVKVLESGVTRRMYFGLSKNFVSWESIAREAARKCGARSEVRVLDKGLSDEGVTWDVSAMKSDFGLEFDPREKISEHLDYYVRLAGHA
ncbi:MAG: NAD(P)-dependent oxidoreductase [Bacteroidota bacterium]